MKFDLEIPIFRVNKVSRNFKTILYVFKTSNFPRLGLGPWRSSSLGFAKKGRAGRLNRRPPGHGGCSVPMNRWTNAGSSIDGHLPIAWRVPYKRVYPRLKAGDAIDASTPMHKEGCMPQVAVLSMCLRLPARKKWTEWMWVPHDCDMF